jgi:hypothetical protein
MTNVKNFQAPACPDSAELQEMNQFLRGHSVLGIAQGNAVGNSPPTKSTLKGEWR